MGLINVLVVDDSVVVRKIVTTVLESDPALSVAGTAANGQIALSKLLQVAPDLVTLDIEMPGMDGIETLRRIRRTHPRLPVVMFSTLTERGATSTLDALSAGASDYVCKPANMGSVPQAMEAVRSQLIPRIKALCPGVLAPVRTALRPATPAVPGPRSAGRPDGSPAALLAIGASTGGPDALTAVLSHLPADLPVPVVVTQHMPPVFTRLFAQRLDGKCRLRVREAEQGDRVVPGVVLIAPGDRHLELRRGADGVRVHLSQAPAENYCRPAVDVMFRSAAQVYGDGVVGVVLTGMGTDGARGAEVLRRGGAQVYVQDQASSVVWGMPGAVVAAGQADRVLPLSAMGSEVLLAVGRRRAPSRTGVPA